MQILFFYGWMSLTHIWITTSLSFNQFGAVFNHPQSWSFRTSKYKGFPKMHKRKIFLTHFLFIFLYFRQFFSQNRMAGCDCWGRVGRLDTIIDKFDISHNDHLSKYVILWHILASAIKIWHKSNLLIFVSKVLIKMVRF